MTLDELLDLLRRIKRKTSGDTRVEVYCDAVKDYIPLEEVALLKGDEFGAYVESVRIS